MAFPSARVMTPQEVLARARAGDAAALAAAPEAVAIARGRRDDAQTRFRAGMSALERLGVTLDPDDRFEVDWLARQVGVAAC